MNIKDCIRGEAKFLFYRKNHLYYQCENGLVFPVPVSDTGDGEFKATEKGIMFMRWIRKYIDSLTEQERNFIEDAIALYKV